MFVAPIAIDKRSKVIVDGAAGTCKLAKPETFSSHTASRGTQLVHLEISRALITNRGKERLRVQCLTRPENLILVIVQSMPLELL